MLWSRFIHKIMVIICIAIFCSKSFAQEYQIKIDAFGSPYEGATFLQSTYNFYKYLDDRFVPSSKDKIGFGWGIARFGHFTVDTLLSSYFTVIQHEIFGHGYRAREFRLPASYECYIDHGVTYISSFNTLSIYQQNSIYVAGMEAETVLAQQIREPWLRSEQIDHRDAVFYILNQLGQFNYVYSTSENDLNYGNDVANYIRGVNSYYGNTGTLSNSKLRTYVLADLLDPALYYSYWAIGKYIYNGAPTVPLYMLSICDYQYLPVIRSILAPYGVELQLQNIIKTPHKEIIQVNLRGGNNSNISTAGIDVNISPIWKYRKFEFANYFSAWYQPNEVYATAALAKSRLGFAEFVGVQYKAGKEFAWLLDVGYKTSGFMQGYQLNNAVIIRAGVKW